MVRGARALPVVGLATVVALLVLVVVAGPARASMTRAFTIRYQTNDTADIWLRGNSLLTCPVADVNCASAVNGTAVGGALNNNNYSMVFTDVDGDPATHSSSSADLTLPAGTTVKWAGLYWSGYTAATANPARTAPPAGTAMNRLLLKTPASTAYQTVTAAPPSPTNPVTGPSTGTPYVSFADVTTLVRNGGSGTYTGADIYAATGSDAYAAWSLVVVVKNASFPLRNLTVFDGFGTIQSTPASDNTLNIPLSGLTTASSGAVDVRLGAVTLEGDAGMTGDSFQFIAPDNTSTTLTNGVNPATNAFNSTVSDDGVDVPGRSPAGNTFGFDADVFESSILIGNSATTATLRMTTGGETFFPAVATFVTNVYEPVLDVVRADAVVDGNGDPARTRTGDYLTYTVDVTNTGNADSVSTVVTDAIPAGTTFVPGSITVGGLPATQAAGDDVADVTGGTLTVRLGSGATDSAGGTLAANATVRITYQVRITGPYTTGGSITGVTDASYADPQANTFTAASNGTSTTVDQALADLAVTQTVSPATVQASGSRVVSWTATVTNNGPDTETAPVLAQALPAGSTSIGAGIGGCSTVGTTVTCPLSTLTTGASTSVTFTATLPANAPDPSTATASVSGDGGDGTPANDTATTAVAVNAAPVAVDDPGALNAPALSVDVDVVGNDGDPDAGDTLTLTTVGTPAHGTASIVAGQLRYTLTDTSFVGTDSVSYTVCDGRGGCGTADLDVVVDDHRVADLVVTQSASPSTVQASGSRVVSWTVVVTNNGPDVSAAPVLSESLPVGSTGVSLSGANSGSCSISGTTVTCPLGALANGATATVTVTATLPANAPDPSGATATVTGSGADPTPADNSAATPVAVNAAPVAVDDPVALTSPALTLDVDVVGNDSDPDAGDTLTLTSVGTPAHGTASIVAGQLRYTLTDITFVGTETVPYTVCDGRGGCTGADALVAVDDHRNADLAVTQSAGPTVVQRGDLPATATWTVTVTNNGPEGEPSPTLTQALPAGVTGVVVTGATCTAVGTTHTCALTALANGATATVTFAAGLPAGAADPSTATATVAGTVPDPVPANNWATAAVAVNTPPVATANTAALPSSTLDVDVDVDAAADDTDADNDPLAVTTTTAPGHGTATLVNGRVRYTLTDFDFVGLDTFTYTVCDGRSGCDTATVTVTVDDHAVADLAVTQSVGPALLQRAGTRRATWTVTVTNGGPQSDAQAVLTETLPAGAGGVDASLPGCTTSGSTVTCPLPALAVGGSTTVTFAATLPADTPDPSTASAQVTPGRLDPTPADNTATTPVAVNTPPEADDESAPLRSDRTTVTVDVLAGDEDADGDPLTLTRVGRPRHGTAAIVDGKIRYTLTDLAFTGRETVTYTVCDDRSGCATATVVITVADHGGPPAATDDSVTTVVRRGVVVDVLANDDDPDGDALTLRRITMAPAHGTATIVNGRLRYVPTGDYIGADTLHYEVCDATGRCDKATLKVRVTSAPPVARTDISTVRPGGTVVVDVLGNDTDPDGDALGSVTIVRPPSTGRAWVDANGMIRYRASGDAVDGSTVSIRYRTCDPTGACTEGTVRLTVSGTPVRTGPLALTGGDVRPVVVAALLLILAGALAAGPARLLLRRRR